MFGALQRVYCDVFSRKHLKVGKNTDIESLNDVRLVLL